MIDLGEVRLDAPPVGTHRWKGLIQARAQTARHDRHLHEMWVLPVDEGYGVLRAPYRGDIGMAAYSGVSSFNRRDGRAHGRRPRRRRGMGRRRRRRRLQRGGRGDRRRSEVSDAAHTGRYVTQNLNLTNTVVQVDIDTERDVGDGAAAEVLARYVDTSNWFRASLVYHDSGYGLDVQKRVAGDGHDRWGTRCSPGCRTPTT